MITLRSARVDDAPEIARVNVDAWRTTYDGLVPKSYLRSLSYETRTCRWHDLLNRSDLHTFVAQEASGRIIGFVNGGPERSGRLGYEGELYAIYLLDDFRGLGIGARLLARLVEALREANLNDMVVWVLEGNRYRGFYEALGGQKVSSQQVKIGGEEFVEVAYGW